MAIDVVVARPDDWQRVRDLRLSALADAPEAFWATLDEERGRSEEQWREWIARDRSRILLASVEDREEWRDVGIVAVGPHHELGDAAGIYSVWVASEGRGRGVGDALMSAAVEHARDLDYPRALLDVGDHNAAAIALYTRAGFTPTGRRGSMPPPRDHITEHEMGITLV